MGRLQGKVAIVTGAASGIGRAAALAFAAEGARVVAGDIDAKGGEATIAAIRAAKGEAVFQRCDVARAADAEALVAAAVRAWGKLDCAFNNAGILEPMGPLHETEEKDYDRVMAINLKGTWHCLRAELKQLLAQGQGGAIVNTSSAAGLASFEGAAAYCASKHGIVGLTRTAAVEYAKQGIRVNAVCPGAIRTPMVLGPLGGEPEALEALAADHPIGRLGEPEEVARAVVWLCSDEASFVTGAALPVDGGLLAR